MKHEPVLHAGIVVREDEREEIESLAPRSHTRRQFVKGVGGKLVPQSVFIKRKMSAGSPQADIFPAIDSGMRIL